MKTSKAKLEGGRAIRRWERSFLGRFLSVLAGICYGEHIRPPMIRHILHCILQKNYNNSDARSTVHAEM